MQFIVTIHWNPGQPKAYPVQAPDAKTAIKMVREGLGHSFTMRATARTVQS
jgi:hypothetical protein